MSTLPFNTHLLVGQHIESSELADASDPLQKIQLELSVVEIKLNRHGRSTIVQSDSSTTVELHVPSMRQSKRVQRFHFFHVTDVTGGIPDDVMVSTDEIRTLAIDELGDTVKLMFESDRSTIRGRFLSIQPGQTCQSYLHNNWSRLIFENKDPKVHTTLELQLKHHNPVLFIHKLPVSKSQVRQVTDMLICGPGLPRVLAELIVTYIVPN